MSNDIANLIQEAMQHLIELGLSESRLKSYKTRAFQPGRMCEIILRYT